VSHAQAVEELRRHAGTQFDPELVGIFCDLFAERAPELDPAIAAASALEVVHRPGARNRRAASSE
jgi:HD-GYP domain-containing protein (c-di-GMP phosphodiesterase class II)